jgi:hypothetical protein
MEKRNGDTDGIKKGKKLDKAMLRDRWRGEGKAGKPRTGTPHHVELGVLTKEKWFTSISVQRREEEAG